MSLIYCFRACLQYVQNRRDHIPAGGAVPGVVDTLLDPQPDRAVWRRVTGDAVVGHAVGALRQGLGRLQPHHLRPLAPPLPLVHQDLSQLVQRRAVHQQHGLPAAQLAHHTSHCDGRHQGRCRGRRCRRRPPKSGQKQLFLVNFSKNYR